jgi:hypothetical protein
MRMRCRWFVGRAGGVSLSLLLAGACSESQTAEETNGADAAADAAGGAETSVPEGGGTGGGGAADVVEEEAVPTPCDPGTAWSVVDDYVYSDTTVQNNPATIVMTKAGELVVTGITVIAGGPLGLIRKSTDGASWTLSKEMKGIGGDLAIAPDGTFFASGGDGANRFVHKSVDGGQMWQEVDSVPFADASACNPGWVKVDSKGVVYSAGSCDSEGWLVRQSTDGGTTWSNVGSFFTLEPGMSARLADLQVDSADHVFVSGTAQDKAMVSHWIVRRLEAGGTWTTVDDFQLEPGGSGFSPQLAGSNRLYAAGGMDTMTAKHWIIRRSDPGGAGWKTIDDWTYPNATGLEAVGVYEGPNGHLVAVGLARDASSVARTVTRRSSDDGQTWSSTEEWALTPGKGSGPGHLIADGRGNVYGTARALAADDRAHWVVRKLACSP